MTLRICDFEMMLNELQVGLFKRNSHCVCLPAVSSGCPWMWDNLTCWQPARMGEVVEVNCPELFSQFISEEDYGQLPRTLHSADFISLTGLVAVVVVFQ